MTNYERIKGMSIEKMAVLLADHVPHGDCYGCGLCKGIEEPYRLANACQDGWLNWLEREVQDNGRYIERKATCKDCLHYGLCCELGELIKKIGFNFINTENICDHFTPHRQCGRGTARRVDLRQNIL